jgi:hypothetical protein
LILKTAPRPPNASTSRSNSPETWFRKPNRPEDRRGAADPLGGELGGDDGAVIDAPERHPLPLGEFAGAGLPERDVGVQRDGHCLRRPARERPISFADASVAETRP